MPFLCKKNNLFLCLEIHLFMRIFFNKVNLHFQNKYKMSNLLMPKMANFKTYFFTLWKVFPYLL